MCLGMAVVCAGVTMSQRRTLDVRGRVMLNETARQGIVVELRLAKCEGITARAAGRLRSEAMELRHARARLATARPRHYLMKRLCSYCFTDLGQFHCRTGRARPSAFRGCRG